MFSPVFGLTASSCFADGCRFEATMLSFFLGKITLKCSHDGATLPFLLIQYFLSNRSLFIKHLSEFISFMFEDEKCSPKFSLFRRLNFLLYIF